MVTVTGPLTHPLSLVPQVTISKLSNEGEEKQRVTRPTVCTRCRRPLFSRGGGGGYKGEGFRLYH